LWGSGPLAFFSGLVLSAAINILTGLALLRTGDWPSRGRTLLLGSFFWHPALQFSRCWLRAYSLSSPEATSGCGREIRL
jgi:hypothetical protein